MTIHVVESGFKQIPCPCGCDLLCEQHDGTLHFGDAGGAYFRALLMRGPDGDPNVWLSLAANAPVGAADTRTWLVTMHGNRDGVRIEDSESSPVAVDSTFSGRNITRSELLSVAGASEFYLECFDALMAKHSRLTSFVLE